MEGEKNGSSLTTPSPKVPTFTNTLNLREDLLCPSSPNTNVAGLKTPNIALPDLRRVTIPAGLPQDEDLADT